MNIVKDPDFMIGVVEDRMDPLMLGRVKVRIMGLHTFDKTLLPTEDLPWAYKVQPTTSGAISGIGHAPVGVMEGTWVLVQFIDPDKQMPFVVGSIGGVPQKKNPPLQSFELDSSASNVRGEVTTEDGTPVTTEDGTPVETEEPPAPEPAPPPKDPAWKEKITKRIGELESSNNYSAVNTLGYLGKYQFGAAALIDRGLVKPGTKNNQLGDPSVWTGKNGIKSKEDFLNNTAVQEQVMSENIDANYKTLKRIGVPIDTLDDAQKGGLLTSAHLYGAGGAKQFYNGVVKADAYGTTTEKYYREGYKAVAGVFPATSALAAGAPATTPDVVADQNKKAVKNAKPSEDEQSQSVSGRVEFERKNTEFLDPTVGFKDPNLLYPLQTHLNEPDTNRLARHQKIEETIVYNKEQTRHTGIEKANGKGSWDQSPTPYNATYPFNNVWQSESGHLLEFDDTKGKERVHMYHAKGTFTEIDHNGTQVNFIVGDNYVIMERNGYVHVVGGLHVKVDGAKTLFVAGNCDVQINGDANVNVHSNTTINTAGDLTLTAGGNINMTAGGSFDIAVGGDYAVDARRIDLNSGFAQSKPTIASIGASTSEPGALNVNTRTEKEAIESELPPDADPATLKKIIEKLVNAGVLSEEDAQKAPEETGESVTPDKNDTPEKPVDGAKPGQKDFDYNAKFSKHYTLSDLTSGGSRKVVDQAGQTADQIYTNLQALANNVLDPIKDKYPNVRINSGLRLGNSTSQHDKGQAVDISFPDLSRAQLYERVQEIQKLVPHDQMILEYLTPGGNGWIHISFVSGKNRGQIFTMNNHATVNPKGSFVKIA